MSGEKESRWAAAAHSAEVATSGHGHEETRDARTFAHETGLYSFISQVIFTPYGCQNVIWATGQLDGRTSYRL